MLVLFLGFRLWSDRILRSRTCQSGRNSICSDLHMSLLFLERSLSRFHKLSEGELELFSRVSTSALTVLFHVLE